MCHGYVELANDGARKWRSDVLHFQCSFVHISFQLLKDQNALTIIRFFERMTWVMVRRVNVDVVAQILEPKSRIDDQTLSAA